MKNQRFWAVIDENDLIARAYSNRYLVYPTRKQARNVKKQALDIFGNKEKFTVKEIWQ